MPPASDSPLDSTPTPREVLAALRASERRFRRLAGAVPQLIWTTDDDGRPNYYNDRWLAYTGQTADEALAPGGGSGAIHPEDFGAVRAGWESTRACGEYEVEYRLRRHDSVYEWHLARVVRVVGEDGVYEWVGSATNIEALRESESRYRALAATLEARVAERTAEVRALAARLTVAEQVEQARIAQVLHDDLQQQLYGLTMTLALLQRAPSVEASTPLVTRASGVLDGAIQMARTLARELSPAVLELDQLGEFLAWVAAQKREKYGLDVSVELRGAPPLEDQVSRVLLYRALCEVLLNVVKHSGGTAARLVGWAEDGLVYVLVEDDGAGFDVAAVVDRRGGGFGLSSVRERLELVGGRFEVESAPGAGTSVTLAVPAGEPSSDVLLTGSS